MNPVRPVADQQNYPRTYRMDRAARQFFHGFGVFLAALFLGVTPLHLLGIMKHSLPPVQLAAMDIVVVTFVIWASWRAERRVILYEDGIEVASWISSRKLACKEIRGRRMGELPGRAGGGSYYIIVPSDRQARELKLPPFLEVDKWFQVWMKAIPRVE